MYMIIKNQVLNTFQYNSGLSATLAQLSRNYHSLISIPSIYSHKRGEIYHFLLQFFHFFCIYALFLLNFLLFFFPMIGVRVPFTETFRVGIAPMTITVKEKCFK